jgi:hypothetical protein
MTIPRSVRKWLRLPSRAALILGLGALSTAGPRTDAQANQTASADPVVRSEGGKIYLSEGGQETELQLGATPQRDRLLRLLEEHGQGGIKLDRDPRLIMSGGGGAGFSLWDIKKSITGKPAAAPPAPPQITAPAVPGLEPGAKRPTPRDHDSTSDKRG